MAEKKKAAAKKKAPAKKKAAKRKPAAKKVTTRTRKKRADMPLDDEVGAILAQNCVTEEDFQKAGVPQETLLAIRDDHMSREAELTAAADSILSVLRQPPAVHSLKMRIKHPSHLVAKVVRKACDKPNVDFDVSTYADHITDLIGIRALHLFKDDWLPIHRFVLSTWNLHENRPIAYYRNGDPDEVLSLYKENNCEIQEHPRLYRSVHYRLELSLTKRPAVAELQVRTLFEEGWSEIDHLVQYPNKSDDPLLAQFLGIFNRLAGGADEMGTFIRRLETRMGDLANQRDVALQELADAVSDLDVSAQEKAEVERLLKQARSQPAAPLGQFTAQASNLGGFFTGIGGAAFSGLANTPISPIAQEFTVTRTCKRCKEPIKDTPGALVFFDDLCLKCRIRPDTIIG